MIEEVWHSDNFPLRKKKKEKKNLGSCSKTKSWDSNSFSQVETKGKGDDTRIIERKEIKSTKLLKKLSTFAHVIHQVIREKLDKMLNTYGGCVHRVTISYPKWAFYNTKVNGQWFSSEDIQLYHSLFECNAGVRHSIFQVSSREIIKMMKTASLLNQSVSKWIYSAQWRSCVKWQWTWKFYCIN